MRAAFGGQKDTVSLWAPGDRGGRGKRDVITKAGKRTHSNW